MRKLKNEELERLSVEEFRQAEKLPVVLVLDNVRSMHNVGSVFRTADAFRVNALYLCGITGKPPDPEIRKTALGATESVSWTYFNDTQEAIRGLKEQGYRICAVEQADEAVSLDHFNPLSGTKLALIFGNEVKGVSEELIPMCDEVIEIPQSGTKHSLNIAVSVGVVVWELYRRIK